MRATSARWVVPLLAAHWPCPSRRRTRIRRTTCTRRGANTPGHRQPDDGVGMFLQREVDTPGSFTQVGHEPLMGRGMNAAIAVHKRYVYVGSRTDGKNNNANHAGIFIVDAQDPAHPVITGDGPAVEGNPQESSRELRVWRSQNILIVLHTNCGGNGAHMCQTPSTLASASTTSRARTRPTRSCCTRTR